MTQQQSSATDGGKHALQMPTTYNNNAAAANDGNDEKNKTEQAPAPAPKQKKGSPGWSDVAWHSTAAMLGAGVVGLPYVFACLGYAGGIVLLTLAIVVSRDTYMCLVRCYEVDGDSFFERRWRHRRERAARRELRARLARRLACGGGDGKDGNDDGSRSKSNAADDDGLARAASGGPGGPECPIAMALLEDELDTDSPARVRDAVTLVDAATGEEVDLPEAEADYCRRRALMRHGRSAAAGLLSADDQADALESAPPASAAAAPVPPTRPLTALFHEYPALSRWAFGRRLGTLLLTPFQTALIVGICISYNIVGAEALFSIVASARALAQTAAGGGGAAATTAALSVLPKAPFYLSFAAVQAALAVSCGSIAESSAVSLGGVVASVVYCGVASALSLAIVAWRSANGDASLPGAAPPSHTPADALYNPRGVATGPDAPGGAALGAAFAALNAVAMFLFTMGGHNIALETQAVLPVPPPSTIPAMSKGVNVAFFITAAACFWTGLTGYAAFGSSVGENILSTISAAAVGATMAEGASSAGTAASGHDGFGGGKNNPLASWPHASIVVTRVLCICAEFAIFAHVIAAYNVYAQTLWVGVERQLARRWREWRRAGGAGGLGVASPAPDQLPSSSSSDKPLALEAAAPTPSPVCGSSSPFRLSPAAAEALVRAPLRVLYVVSVLAVAVAIPFFGPVVGIVGAFCITPTTFVLPYALEILRHRTYDRSDDGLGKGLGSSLPSWRVAACWVGGLGASAVGLAGTAASVYLISAQLRAKH